MASLKIRGVMGLALLALGAGVWAPGCGGDDVGLDGGTVGGACRDDFDCEYRCVRGGHFPDGSCTVPCRFHEDCPGGSWCVDEAGGVCLLECLAHVDCRPGYVCDNRRAYNAPGDVYVCIND